MQAKDIIAKVEQLAEPIMSENDYELVEVEFVKEGPNWYLRLYVDKDGGFTLNDCEFVSRALDKMINEELIEQAYILEVSSPGIDRVLKKESEYIKYKGKTVDVKLYKAIDKVKEFQGELVGLIEDNIVIKEESGEEVSFPKKDVATCRLAVIL